MERNDFINLQPMLLSEEFKPFDDKNFIYELKFDGIRSLIHIKNGEITIRSRKGVILNEIYPELDSIKNISNDECIFDGEIVLLEDNKPSFTKVMERFKLKDKNKIMLMMNNYPVTFVCFDILYKNKDLTGLSLIERKNILNKFKDSQEFVKVKYIENNGKDLFNVVKENGLEGIIAKSKDSKYYYGLRTKDWIKIKNWITEDFFVCGYEYTKSESTINIILGEKINNKYYYIGSVVMGVKNKLYNKIIESNNADNYLINYNNNINFIKPKYKLYRKNKR